MTLNDIWKYKFDLAYRNQVVRKRLYDSAQGLSEEKKKKAEEIRSMLEEYEDFVDMIEHQMGLDVVKVRKYVAENSDLKAENIKLLEKIKFLED